MADAEGFCPEPPDRPQRAERAPRADECLHCHQWTPSDAVWMEAAGRVICLRCEESLTDSRPQLARGVLRDLEATFNAIPHNDWLER